ncbi:MAG: hypothetical protein N2999_04170 [Proteobacteria bacterium]|nr:hypothetical protein [Pseudomonadota bacterium]
MADSFDFIKVATIFKKGMIFPIWFERKGQKYPIDKILYRWEERKGRSQILYFSVVSGEENYNIAFDSENFIWHIIEG